MGFRAHPDTKEAVIESNFIDTLIANLESKHDDIAESSLA